LVWAGWPLLTSVIINFFPRKVKYCDIFQESFSDPKSLTEDLHYSGFKGIWMLDPGIKQEKGYFAYDSGSENDVWVQKADRTPFVGNFSLYINNSSLYVLLFGDALSAYIHSQGTCGLDLVSSLTIHSPKFVHGGQI
jgi:hypothetical protein